MESWVRDLRYVLMSPRHPARGYEKEYSEAYEVWKSAWEKYRKELGITSALSSDGLMIPDEMGVLFYQGDCVGFSCFTHGNLERGPLRDLQWFKAWTPEAMVALAKISTDIIICSQFTVNPKFTGKGHIVRWKEIVFLYTFMRFDSSEAGVMAGHLNLLRGMQNACGETFGATILNPNHSFDYCGLNLPAQLVAYERENIRLMKERKGIENLCDDLWSRLEHISEFSVENNIIPFKKSA